MNSSVNVIGLCSPCRGVSGGGVLGAATGDILPSNFTVSTGDKLHIYNTKENTVHAFKNPKP